MGISNLPEQNEKNIFSSKKDKLPSRFDLIAAFLALYASIMLITNNTTPNFFILCLLFCISVIFFIRCSDKNPYSQKIINWLVLLPALCVLLIITLILVLLFEAYIFHWTDPCLLFLPPLIIIFVFVQRLTKLLMKGR